MGPLKFEFEAIGTRWIIDIFNPLSKSSSANIFKKIRERIELFDLNYSRFRKDSWVTQMSQKVGTYNLPEDANSLITLYKTLYKITQGKFTPLIGDVLVKAGYDAEYSLKSKKLKKPLSWEQSISYTPPNLIIKKPVLLDFGAAGKGYLIDILGKLLKQNKIFSFCIDAGGDILYENPGNKPLKIGLEHPENFEMVIGVLELVNKSICGSAGNRRKWGNLHHIIDPTTLSSPKKILATWVVAKEAIIADGLSTCLFLTDAELFAKHFSFEYLIVYSDYSIKKSEGFKAELFFTKKV